MSDEWRGTLVYPGVLTVAVGALAGVVARMTVLVPLDRSASTVEARLGAGLVVVLVAGVALTLLAAVTVLPAYGLLSDRIRAHEVPWFVLAALGVVVCFGVGFVGVQPFAGGFAEATTDTYGGFAGPHAAFEVEERPADGDRVVVAFTHDGGDRLLAENLEVRGEGFAAVDGVDQQTAGPWRGEVGGERHRRGGRAVVPGDAVTVGAEPDCELRVVYDDGDQAYTTAYHRCGEERPAG